jgi:cell division control protein 45
LHFQDLRTVVMINCGGTEDVRELCSLHEHVRVVIIDSHRPIWHGYRHTGDEMLVLLDADDPVKLEDIPDFGEEG